MKKSTKVTTIESNEFVRVYTPIETLRDIPNHPEKFISRTDLFVDSAVLQAVSVTESTKTIDFSLGNISYITLESNVTLSFINPSVGVYIFYLRQDATGSRTVTWPSNVKWPNAAAPTLTTTALAWDIVTLMYDGLYFSATSTLNFVA